jgi:putative flippase GtrA
MRKLLKNKLFNAEFIKFILVGLTSTVLTYLIYLLLLQALHYQIAYAIAYIIGIVYSYFANSKFTFKERLKIKKFIAYPIVYVVQYSLCVALLYLFISVFGMHKALAPLLVIIVTTPITFIFSRYIIKYNFSNKYCNKKTVYDSTTTNK